LLRSTGDEPTTGVAAPSGHRAFIRGLLVDLSNPKAAVFFTTLFASLLPETLTIHLAGLVLASVALVVYGWYVLLAVVASQPSFHTQYRRRESTINRVAAAALAMLGLRLAFTIPESADVG
jgi:threonine/homoserine/homoserine lactone efflux protein